jgi:hypothetical protein
VWITHVELTDEYRIRIATTVEGSLPTIPTDLTDKDGGAAENSRSGDDENKEEDVAVSSSFGATTDTATAASTTADHPETYSRSNDTAAQTLILIQRAS